MLSTRSSFLVLGVTLSLGAIFLSCSSAAAVFCDEIFSRIFAGITNHETRAGTHFILEKGVHVTLFLILGLLLMNVMNVMNLTNILRAPSAWRIFAVLVSAVVVGSAAEYVQTFFPGRDPAIRDVVIDVCGVSIGIAISLVRRPPSLVAVPKENHL